MGKITKKQKQVYDYICEYLSENGYSPTQREIQEHFGFKSLGSVQDYIRYLTQANYLNNDPNSVRGLEPTNAMDVLSLSQNSEEEIPLLGKVAAGNPIEASEHNKFITVPKHMLGKGRYYALTVQGQSMIEDGILDGDVIVVKEQNNAVNGETIIAMIDNEATVKRYKKEKDHIKLIPANSSMSPIMVSPDDPFEIKGVLVGLLRSY